MEEKKPNEVNEKKRITDENVSLTDCRKFTRSMRNCAHCNKPNKPEACKKCPPRPVVQETDAALTFWFKYGKKIKPIMDKILNIDDKQVSIVDNKATSSIENRDSEVSEVNSLKY